MAVGAPDHNIGMFPLKNTQGTNQSRYIVTGSASVPAGGSAILSITIPAATRRIFASIDVMSEASCIQNFYVDIDATTLFKTTFDVSKFMGFADAGQLVGEAGEVWDFYIENNDTVTRTMRMNLVATDEDA